MNMSCYSRSTFLRAKTIGQSINDENKAVAGGLRPVDALPRARPGLPGVDFLDLVLSEGKVMVEVVKWYLAT